ncbi:T-cell surface glycoprotein CD8 alpha chain [Sebastes umbrosus]|uniref:T-cell surface glycoprotein CD8 alpha chain n=1 Tax=Sebastes umbrosus TaxID=72105 RepID=UPI00189E0149|nr:T-cell surface glycoprotein CD8 alpha chain [Sebastes umbrosus]XP_037639025.1 T-cell surface glycoprotein CD8 alpha chain [Sebastes umbrosus]XP_037639027.1 T-cell surface glycoprotein CD8 alpha chain [Sebastes umbrosus]
MDQKWIQILGILVFCQQMTSGAGEDITAKEGQPVQITCKPAEAGSMIVWFRVLDTSGMEFIASFTNNGLLKSPLASFPSTFSYSRIREDILILLKFSKDLDSGVYSCASLFGGKELKFGNVIRLGGKKVKSTEAPRAAATTTEQTLCTTATPCVCNKKAETRPELFCSLIILGPLAGGCGLLLLILIITSVYCHQIRTRRCPHHYKRKPRVVAPGKQMMTKRPV